MSQQVVTEDQGLTPTLSIPSVQPTKTGRNGRLIRSGVGARGGRSKRAKSSQHTQSSQPSQCSQPTQGS